MKGTVFNESKRREFTFEGVFEKGRFSSNHAEIRRGERRRTGTLWLERYRSADNRRKTSQPSPPR